MYENPEKTKSLALLACVSNALTIYSKVNISNLHTSSGMFCIEMVTKGGSCDMQISSRIKYFPSGSFLFTLTKITFNQHASSIMQSHAVLIFSVN